ncbi:trxB1 protein [Lacticaseibacillus thailandensis DSM 22698 = JCM 13996]|uniref:Ferredoxin--NADP reductase n=2 Tax=Lacticaseibacillus thailandensis TaxID=381741 RepID=A0A0R2C8X0_9LACO|nr:trxB1 protein [Lacticaseibacillus thailandensis DSM 22698 = JCM 13996]
MLHQYEITIVGGGPAGMFAAFYAGMRGADVLLVESTAALGGQPATQYPQKMIYDIAGIDGVNGVALTQRLAQQMDHFQPEIRLDTRVDSINPATGTDLVVDWLQVDANTPAAKANPHGYILQTNQGSIATQTVLIATGGGAFAPRRLAVDYPTEWDGQRVIYTVRDVAALTGQTLAIAGGGDSAIDWALTLVDRAQDVHLIHRRQQFRGLESSVAQLKQSRVHIHTPFVIDGLSLTANDQLAVDLRPVHGDEHEHLVVDRLLVNYGFASDNKQLRRWELALDHNLVTVDRLYQTSRPGIFAIGDVVTYPGKVKLIANAFGEAPIAVDAALRTIHPDLRQPPHSAAVIGK